MSIQQMRPGDTIISADGAWFEVIEKDWKTVTAISTASGRKRKFKDEKIFCVDFDDGLWQETIN